MARKDFFTRFIMVYPFQVMKSLVTIVICLLSIQGLSQTTLTVKTDSYSRFGDRTPGKVLLMPADSTFNESEIKNFEFVDYVKKTLVFKGYHPTTALDSAELLVFYHFGISDPISYKETVMSPVLGTIPGSRYQSGSTQKVQGGSYTQTSTTYSPRLGLVGATPVKVDRTVFVRFVSLTAFSLDPSDSTAVWTITSTSTGTSDDLRLVFPYLLTATFPYIGKSSGQKVESEFKFNPPKKDKRVTKFLSQIDSKDSK